MNDWPGSLHQFHRRDLAATPWKNGGGRTQEIVRYPANAPLDDFEWRVSIAEISADGPFSPFEGVDRVIALLQGMGVVMHFADGTTHTLSEPHVPFAFGGEDVITATLNDGPSSDFNVMTRRTSASADVRAVALRDLIAPAPAGLLFAARGTWRATARGASAIPLAENGGVWWNGDSFGWDVEPSDANAVLLAVRITQQQPSVL